MERYSSAHIRGSIRKPANFLSTELYKAGSKVQDIPLALICCKCTVNTRFHSVSLREIYLQQICQLNEHTCVSILASIEKAITYNPSSDPEILILSFPMELNADLGLERFLGEYSAWLPSMST